MAGVSAVTPSSEPKKQLSVGIVMAERIYAAVVVDHKVQGNILSYPPLRGTKQDADEDDSLIEMPTDALVDAICELAVEASKGHEGELVAIGIALPGLIRNGVVEEAPNLQQLKGARIGYLMSQALSQRGVTAPVNVLNDADAIAAGLASKHGKLDRFLRVWTLGTGIGYGCYPFDTDAVGEGGHTVVTLDEKENFCGCGGRGHLEGIMGHRAMRLRFLDMEPEEVFEAANQRKDADVRCSDFKHLWHKALAAATASSIHINGGGPFFITGYNVRFLELNMLKDYLHQMVKMSPLQNYSVEVVEDEQSTRVIGAAVAAEQAAQQAS